MTGGYSACLAATLQFVPVTNCRYLAIKESLPSLKLCWNAYEQAWLLHIVALVSMCIGMDFVQSMEAWAKEAIEPLLMSSSNAWQPSDLLPDPGSPDFIDAIRSLRCECQSLPAEYLVVLVGDMVTEEALPSYMSMLNRMDGTKDATGVPL